MSNVVSSYQIIDPLDVIDSTGAPRPVVNSKGRRRRPGTKTLAGVLKCDDELFVDFVAKCLVWDPERRMKPQPALRHPFVTAPRARFSKGPTATPSKSLLSSGSGNLSSSSRNTNKVTETPKKSQIGAPTPLTARATRAPTTSVPQTPVGSGVLHSLGPRYRTSVSSSHQSARYAVSYQVARCSVSKTNRVFRRQLLQNNPWNTGIFLSHSASSFSFSA